MSQDTAMLPLQLERLKRHWLKCREGYDLTALLDLAHSLRVISEASQEVAQRLASMGAGGLPHGALTKKLKSIIGKSDFIALLLPGGVKTKNVEMSTMVMIKRHLADEEALEMSRLLHSHIAGDTLAPKAWFGAEVIIVRGANPSGKVERTGLSRISTIKRVANTLGGSHVGDDSSDGKENSQDWAVKEALGLTLNGIPAPYCVLMKIAQDILERLDPGLAALNL